MCASFMQRWDSEIMVKLFHNSDPINMPSFKGYAVFFIKDVQKVSENKYSWL